MVRRVQSRRTVAKTLGKRRAVTKRRAFPKRRTVGKRRTVSTRRTVGTRRTVSTRRAVSTRQAVRRPGAAATAAFAARAVLAAQKENARRKKSAALMGRMGMGAIMKPTPPPRGMGGSGLPFKNERSLLAARKKAVYQQIAGMPSAPTHTPSQFTPNMLPSAPTHGPSANQCKGPGASQYRQVLLARMQRLHDELVRCRG